MSKSLFDQLMSERERPRDRPTRPPLPLVGIMVRWERQLRQWKVATLASFSSVSVSTVERVERGEPVSDDALDKIAIGLGYEAGHFTDPRIPKSQEESLKSIEDTYGALEPLSVRELNNEKTLRDIARTDALVIHRPLLTAEHDGVIAGLAEWLDFLSFELSEEFGSGPDASIRRRRLYRDALDYVESLNRERLTVLAGVFETTLPRLGAWKVAVVAISPKARDPGAPKRKVMLLDCRILAPENMTWDLVGQDKEAMK